MRASPPLELARSMAVSASAPPAELPLQNLRLGPICRSFVGRVGEAFAEVPQRGRQLFAPAEPLEQAHVLGDRLDVRRIEGQRPRGRGQRLFGAPETNRAETRRLHLEAAGAGGIRLTGGLPGEHAAERARTTPPVVRAPEAGQHGRESGASAKAAS